MDESPSRLKSDSVLGWVVLPVLALILMFAPMPDGTINDFYAVNFYPRLQRAVTSATNFLSFSVLDVLLVAVGLMGMFSALRLLRTASNHGLMEALWDGSRRLLRGGALVIILFLLGWGYNYRRTPLESALPGGKATAPTTEALQAAVLEANALGGKLRKAIGSDMEQSYEEVAGALSGPMDIALKQLQQPTLGTPGRPKHSIMLTPFFTWAGVTGMINPIGLESIVHPELLPFERPFVLAHEWAHLAGQADEAQASAVGWLSCMRGTAPLAYSASLYLIMEAASAMPSDARQVVMKQLDPGVKADIDAILVRLQRGKPSVQRTASRVYDEYLRANRVADGTASYGRALSLILSPPLREALSGYTVTERQQKIHDPSAINLPRN
ncbi:MAG TPA: DUF3810 family protein [Vicinamibacterales bacterium]|nr:DUF3810 family protein [Vicinamibacterales bacterium]